MMAFGGSGLCLLSRGEAAGVILLDIRDEPLGCDEPAGHGRLIAGGLVVELDAWLVALRMRRNRTRG